MTNKYSCDICNYNTNIKQNYDKHLLTDKHINNNNNNIVCKYECKSCNKKYKSNTGLWKHKKTCKEIKEVKIEVSNELMNTIIIQNKEITEQNKEQNEEIKELKNMIIQLLKNQPASPIETK